jgi:hypothetical protein
VAPASAEGQPADPQRLPRLWNALGQGVIWGGLNGVLFLLCLVGVFAPVILAQGVPDVSAAVLGLGIYLLIGAAVAFLIGAVVGLVFGALDYALLVLAEVAIRRSQA